MWTLLLAGVGVMLGTTASRVHPVVNPGLIASAVAGAIGGLLGARWWGETLAGPLAGHEEAGALAAAGLGGALFGVFAGLLWSAGKRWGPGLVAAGRAKWDESRATPDQHRQDSQS